MARPRTIVLDAAEASRRYESGATLGQLAAEYAVSVWTVRCRIVEQGAAIRPAKRRLGKGSATPAMLAAAARRRGVRLGPRQPTPPDLRRRGDEYRTLDKIKIGDGCWEWQGGVASTGYGVASVDSRYVNAHRAVYELLVGPIPAGLMLHHECHNTACVRPGHLRPMTPAEHSHAHRKQTCERGHPFTRESTYRAPGKPNSRVCLICKREYARSHREEINEAKRRRRARARAEGRRVT